MLELKTYKFNDFCEELKIPRGQRERRLKELLNWLTNFYSYEFIKGKGTPHYITIKEIYGEYQPLPRKNVNTTKQKHEEVKTFICTKHLTSQFQLTSKTHAAREYIKEEGYEKYGLTNCKYVASAYVKEVFDTYAESDGKYVQAWFSTYTVIPEDILSDWANIRREERIHDEAAASAFYKMAQGEDIGVEMSRYERALTRFREKYNDTPVYVESWRLKEESAASAIADRV